MGTGATSITSLPNLNRGVCQVTGLPIPLFILIPFRLPIFDSAHCVSKASPVNAERALFLFSRRNSQLVSGRGGCFMQSRMLRCSFLSSLSRPAGRLCKSACTVDSGGNILGPPSKLVRVAGIICPGRIVSSIHGTFDEEAWIAPVTCFAGTVLLPRRLPRRFCFNRPTPTIRNWLSPGGKRESGCADSSSGIITGFAVMERIMSWDLGSGFLPNAMLWRPLGPRSGVLLASSLSAALTDEGRSPPPPSLPSQTKISPKELDMSFGGFLGADGSNLIPSC